MKKGESAKSLFVTNRFVSTGITVVFGAALTFSGQTMSIWPVFGSANQFLAALALFALTVWVVNLKKGYLFVFIPMLFMFAVTLTALGMLIYQNFVINNYTLSIISVLLFSLAVLLGGKSLSVLLNGKEISNEIVKYNKDFMLMIFKIRVNHFNLTVCKTGLCHPCSITQ